ncbi:hypothetical protein BGX30_007424 [Mortierella sp. GBA39]|nr:hypothetical protein BGX30_007424 [Mortierella sp. GBA39]
MHPLANLAKVFSCGINQADCIAYSSNGFGIAAAGNSNHVRVWVDEIWIPQQYSSVTAARDQAPTTARESHINNWVGVRPEENALNNIGLDVQQPNIPVLEIARKPMAIR